MLMRIGEFFLKLQLHSKWQPATVKTKEQRAKTMHNRQQTTDNRQKENSPLPSLGKQEVKLILLCPTWASKKQNRFSHPHLGKARSKTDSSIPSLGKQEVKPIFLCPTWASTKKNHLRANKNRMRFILYNEINKNLNQSQLPNLY